MVLHRLVELAVMVGEVPFSTSLRVATRHVASERLDLFLRDTLDLGPKFRYCGNGNGRKVRRRIWPRLDIRFPLMLQENASLH